MRHPPGMWARGTVPATRDPDIVSPIPTVIAGDPYESPLRRWSTTLYDRSRRSDPNVNLSIRGCGEHCESKQNCQDRFLHSRETPSALNMSPELNVHSGLLLPSTCFERKSCARPSFWAERSWLRKSYFATAVTSNSSVRASACGDAIRHGLHRNALHQADRIGTHGTGKNAARLESCYELIRGSSAA